MKNKSLYIAQAAIIAAVYVLITLAIAPISSGLIQCRFSEALCILPFFTPAAIPGLFVGCLLANLITGAVIYDVICGSLATLLAAAFTWQIARACPCKLAKALAPLPAVLVNAVVVGYLLAYVYAVPAPFVLCMLYVAAGQIIACYGAGLPLLLLLERYGNKLFHSRPEQPDDR